MTRQQALNYLVGWVMKRKPNANPVVVREMLLEKLGV